MTSSRSIRRCPNCGARVTPESPGACAFCGAELLPSASPVLSKAQRFELLRRHPACPRLLARKPSTAGLMRVNGLLFVALCGAAVLSGGIGFAGLENGDPAAFSAIAIAIGALVAIALLLRSASQRARHGLRAVPAVVVRKQERGVTYSAGTLLPLAYINPGIWATSTVISAAGDTSPRATIELYDGNRLDLELVDAIERTVEPGDLGIAYISAGYLVDFARVEG